MEISKLLFFAFAAMVMLPVVYLVFAKDIIRAAFAVVISLLGIAALFVLLHAEYMAVVQILIYAGGVIVLLIFGIMLTKRIGDEGVFTQHRGIFSGVLAFVAFLSILVWLIRSAGEELTGETVTSGDQVKQIGVLFLTDYLLAFELIAFILLVALVGAAFLAKKSSNV